MKFFDKIKNKKRFCIMLVLAVVLVCLTWFAVAAVLDICGVVGAGEVMVTVPKGAGTGEVAQILKEAEIIDFPMLFKLKVKMSGGCLFQMGIHRMDKSMSYDEIIAKLEGTPEVFIDEAVKVVIPEGYEVRQIAKVLEEKGLADAEKFIAEAEKGSFDYEFIDKINRTENRLEGYLFPATYEILPSYSEHEIIDRMLEAFERNIVPVYEKSNTTMTLDEVVIMASLVEREAANDSERGKVASVFYNRINANMTLSSCASVQYIIKERKPILSNSDIKIKSPYNTYINKGLPIGPIASPGKKSVMAALEPEDTDFYYFVARPDGSENVFSKTGEEHMRKVQIIQGGN